MDKKRCIELIRQYSIHISHSLGQNFLIDEFATDEIMTYSGISEESVVLEIGPGLGALTEKLSEIAKEVFAVEIDAHLLPALHDSFDGKGNVHIIHSDFLSLSAEQIFTKTKPSCIVSNLPYYAMTPIMTKIFRDYPHAEKMVFTVEEDACDRIFATPGSKNYGPLAVLSTLYGIREKLAVLDGSSFFPAPHTNSAVIRLTNRGILSDAPECLFTVIFSAFSQRRKKLINSLMSGGIFPGGKEQLLMVLAACSISSDLRAEQLLPEDYLKISRALLASNHNDDAK